MKNELELYEDRIESLENRISFLEELFRSEIIEYKNKKLLEEKEQKERMLQQQHKKRGPNTDIFSLLSTDKM